MSLDLQTRQLFYRQLAHWAEAVLGQGRYPFRKVETAPVLFTAQGPQQPALVFWINRDSFMAGGVVLCPEQSAEQSHDIGAACANALGLRHFVTWAPREVAICEVRDEGLLRGKTIPLTTPGEGGRHFHAALERVMDELKVLSVLGAVPPDQLSPYYLVNLCLETLKTVEPVLARNYRIACSEASAHVLAKQPTAALAGQKGAMTLLRLLCLTYYDALPATVQPEGLERAMEFALDALPSALRPPFRQKETERPLPEECTIHFHHLFRRLTQLRWWDDVQRATQTLELLLTERGKGWGGHPLPVAAPPATGPVLLVNAATPVHAGKQISEIATTPLLALNALLRDLQACPQPEATAGDVFSFSPLIAPDLLLGTLTDARVPTAQERKTIGAKLRLGWPTRRFALPTSTPLWVWEFLHLLGIAAGGSRILLALPECSLAAPFWSPLTELIREQFTLTGLHADNASLFLRLIKEPREDASLEIIGQEGSRRLAWSQVRDGHWAWLPLALELAEAPYALLTEERLRICTPATWPGQREREVFLFARSSLGRRLWHLVSGGRPLPARERMAESFCHLGLPLPESEILENLRLFPWRDGTPPPEQQALDRELGLWFAQNLSLAEQRPTQRRLSFPAGRPKGERNEPALMAEITREAFVDGLPQFPEQYLYDHFRPELREYRFAGPLSREEEFFGRIALVDQQGDRLEVEGGETALALLLASYSGRTPVALPVDRRLAAEILARYRQDLLGLRQNLLRLAHTRIADPRRAAALVERIWNRHSLPPWRLVQE